MNIKFLIHFILFLAKFNFFFWQEKIVYDDFGFFFGSGCKCYMIFKTEMGNRPRLPIDYVID